MAGRPHAPDDLVFTAPLGGPLRESKFVPGYFKPAVRAVGLPTTLRFYDLRHTAASLLIREGASIKAVQKQLGHATASITLDTYGHLFPDELDALAGRAGGPARPDAGVPPGRRRVAPWWPRSRRPPRRCRQMTRNMGAGGGARTLFGRAPTLKVVGVMCGDLPFLHDGAVGPLTGRPSAQSGLRQDRSPWYAP
jgi:hypothetical protein